MRNEQQSSVDLSSPHQLLTIEEFCQWAQIGRRTFRDWVAAGTAPRRIRVGRGLRIKASDALAWAEARYVKD